MDGLTPQGSTQLLEAGPLTLAWCDGQVRYIRYGDREIIRRIYVAIRDVSWKTIPGVIEDLSVEPVGDGFVARWDSVHDAGSIKFRWHGTVSGDSTGAITFSMEGESQGNFEANRIGLCLLHPIDELRGVRCAVETVDGQTSRGEFPRLIHPHLPFSNVRNMRYVYDDGTEVSLAFEGDTFETEDQRQWGDASWKTYSRPAALPKPFAVRSGQRFSQSVTLDVVAGRTALSPWRAPEVVRVSVDASVGYELPALGLGWNGKALTEVQRQTLSRALPGFLRVEIVPARTGLVRRLQAATDESQALAAPLVLVVQLSRNPAREIAALVEALELVRPKIAAVTVMSLVDHMPVPDVVRSLKTEVSKILPGVPVGLGVYPDFTKLNRERELVGDADFVAYPWSPTLHLDDDATIVENLPVPIAVAETVRSFAGGKPVAIDRVLFSASPISRHDSLLAAGFALGHLAVAAKVRLVRTALFDTGGPQGVVAADGQQTPVFQVLCDVAEFRGAVALKTRVAEPLQVAALVLQRESAVRVLLANLNHTPTSVDLNLMGLRANGGAMRRLGPAQWKQAVEQGPAFRASAASLWDGGLIALGPQEFVRLDLG